RRNGRPLLSCSTSPGTSATEKMIGMKTILAPFVWVMLACSFAQAQPSVNSVKPSSGKALCSALTPADFTKAGVEVSALRQANLDGNDGAYCVYDSKAGNVEFDIFFPAGATPVEVKATEKTVLVEVGANMQAVALPGADAAHISVPTAGSASIV